VGRTPGTRRSEANDRTGNQNGRYNLFTLEGMWVGQEAGTGQLLELDDMIAKRGPRWIGRISCPSGASCLSTGQGHRLPLETNITMTAYVKTSLIRRRSSYLRRDEATRTKMACDCQKLHKDGQIGRLAAQADDDVCQHWGKRWSRPRRFFDEKLNHVILRKPAGRAVLRDLLPYAPEDMLNTRT